MGMVLKTFNLSSIVVVFNKVLYGSFEETIRLQRSGCGLKDTQFLSRIGAIHNEDLSTLLGMF